MPASYLPVYLLGPAYLCILNTCWHLRLYVLSACVFCLPVFPIYLCVTSANGKYLSVCHMGQCNSVCVLPAYVPYLLACPICFYFLPAWVLSACVTCLLSKLINARICLPVYPSCLSPAYLSPIYFSYQSESCLPNSCISMSCLSKFCLSESCL